MIDPSSALHQDSAILSDDGAEAGVKVPAAADSIPVVSERSRSRLPGDFDVSNTVEAPNVSEDLGLVEVIEVEVFQVSSVSEDFGIFVAEDSNGSNTLVAHATHDQPSLLHSIQSLIYIIVVAVFIITFCAQPFRIPSGSMEPTLLIGDFLLVDKQVGESGGILPPAEIYRGEIIVFHYPIDPVIHLVKRVVGMPGDRLKLRHGQVFINDLPLAEPYTMYLPTGPDSFRDNFPRLQSADPNIDSRWWIKMRTLIDEGELIIPADNYFVLGDNRNNSEDSRYWGFVPRSSIVGRPFLIYFSLQQGSDTPHPPPTAVSGLQRSKAIDAVADFARWGRTLQVVR